MPSNNLSTPTINVLEKLRTLGLEVKETGADRWQAQCPAHSDVNPSLSISQVNDGKVILHCMAGCSVQDVVAALGLEMKDLFPPRPQKSKKLGKIVKTYDYVDEDKNLLFQCVRYEPKTFRQRRPHPTDQGKWIWNLKGARYILYRLPELLAADPSRAIFVLEGEKDVNNLYDLGLIATTNPMGAGKWSRVEDAPLYGRRVIIIPDNGSAGERHAIQVANLLHNKAEEVRILRLPGLGEKEDITDWIRKGGDRTKLLVLADKAEKYVLSGKLAQPIRTIYINDFMLNVLTQEAVEALEIANDPPTIFVRDGELCRAIRDEKNRPKIDSMNKQKLRHRLSQVAYFVVKGSKGDTYRSPPDHVVESIGVLPEWPFPSLEAVSSVPILRADGSIHDIPGYDAETKSYYLETINMEIPPISDNPTPQERQEAKQMLLDIIRDFPFVDDGSKANIFGLLFSILMRPVIKSYIPICLIDAPKQGTGKTKLAHVVSIITTGEISGQTAPSKREDGEWRKRITSVLLAADPLAIIDNLPENAVFDSYDMGSVVTSKVWKDRTLGRHKLLKLPIHTTWVCTGNNIRLAGDLPRRCYTVKLDADVEFPWLREGFKYEDIEVHIMENRGKFLWAAFTLITAWYAAGQPAADVPTIGSFNDWAKKAGGVIAHAGIEGFLQNIKDTSATQDDHEVQWRLFFDAWWELFGDQVKTTAEVCTQVMADGTTLAAATPDMLLTAVAKGMASLKRSVGSRLSRLKGKIFNGKKLFSRVDSHKKTKCWQLKPSSTTLAVNQQGFPTIIFDEVKELMAANADVEAQRATEIYKQIFEGGGFENDLNSDVKEYLLNNGAVPF